MESNEEHFIESLKANPSDNNLKLVFADWLEENGRIIEALELRKGDISRYMGHRWEDVSYHGSPIYKCEFCGCGRRSDLRASLPCGKREECIRKENEKKEQEEKYEYLRRKAENERWEYLKNKYENKE